MAVFSLESVGFTQRSFLNFVMRKCFPKKNHINIQFEHNAVMPIQPEYNTVMHILC